MKKKEKEKKFYFTDLEFFVGAESEYSKAVNNVLFEGRLLLVGSRKGRLLTRPRRSRWPRRSRMAVTRMTGPGKSEAKTGSRIFVLAAVAVLLVVRPLPCVLLWLLLLLLLLRGGQTLSLCQHTLGSFSSPIPLIPLFRLDLHLEADVLFPYERPLSRPDTSWSSPPHDRGALNDSASSVRKKP